MNTVTNNYNTYIKLPNNIGVINIVVDVYCENTKIKSYDTSNLQGNDKYQLLLFNGVNWRKMLLNGIDTNKYKVVAVNFNFDKSKNYTIEYYFKTLAEQVIQLEYNSIYITNHQNNNNNILTQRLNVVQDVQAIYDNTLQEYKPLLLHWEHSWDYDNDFIYYEIQIYKLVQNVIISTTQNGIDSYSQERYYQLVLSQDNIEKNSQSVQKRYYDEQLFQQNSIYRYKVRAKDSYGQYSNWSDYYYFKKTKGLYGSVLVRRKYFSQLNNAILILPPITDLSFGISIKQRPHSQFTSSVHIKQPQQLKLNFGIIVQHRVSLYSQFFSSIHVVVKNNELNMNTIVSKRFFNQLYNSVYVFAGQNQLRSKIQVAPTLIHRIWVNGVYNIDQLIQTMQVVYGAEPLDQAIQIRRRFVPSENILKGFLTIGKRFQAPIQLQVYNNNNQLQLVDNRIKIYTSTGQRIYTYNVDGQFVNVYPYVQNGTNNPFSIYDYNGNQLIQYYDENGQFLPCVYTNENLIKNWLPLGNYKIQYTYYDYLTTYLYNYARQSNIQVLYPTNQNFIHVQLNQSGQWTFAIRAIRNNTNIHLHDTYEKIYLNIPPVSVELPFYIDGQLMNNYNVINNSTPTFTFYGVRNQDNDIYKYIIQIAKDSDFQNIVIQNQLLYSNQIINHTIQEGILHDEGNYFVRILTVDYDTKEEKQVAISPYRQFRYQHYSLNLYGTLQRVNKSWITLGFMAMMRGNSTLNQQLTLFKNFQVDQFIGKIFLYYENILTDEVEQQIVVRTNNQDDNIIGNIMILKNYSELNSNVLIQYHYHNFPKTITYIDSNGLQHTQIIMPVPPQHYLYGKCMVYHGNTQNLPEQVLSEYPYTIKFGGLQVKRRYQSIQDQQPIHSIVVMKRFDSTQQKMQCRVWNVYELPCSTNPLTQMVAISNRVNMIAWLFGQVTLRYPQPPTVIVTSNIQQKVWQTQYNATFNFSLQQQSKLPLLWYVYVLDDRLNTIPTFQNGQLSYGQVRCDLREVGSKQTGVKYIHVRSVNTKYVYSQKTTTYCIYYNNKVDRPTPESVNGQTVLANQMPIIQYNSSLMFYWSMVIDTIDVVDKITYDLQIATDINFTNIQFEEKNIYGNFFSLLPRTLAPNKYFWRVRAFDQNQYSDWSISATIYINKAPQPPTRLSVKNYS